MKWNGWFSSLNLFLPGNGPYIIERVINFDSGVRRHAKTNTTTENNKVPLFAIVILLALDVLIG